MFHIYIYMFFIVYCVLKYRLWLKCQIKLATFTSVCTYCIFSRQRDGGQNVLSIELTDSWDGIMLYLKKEKERRKFLSASDIQDVELATYVKSIKVQR